MLSIFREPEIKTPHWLRETIGWKLSDVLFELKTTTGKDKIYLADVLRGIQVFGANGGGKTSGAGRTVARAFIENGFGGLVLCVKNDEAKTWRKYCKDAGREKDLVVVNAEGMFGCNIFDSLARDKSEDVRLSTISNFISDVATLYSRDGENKSGSDPFWEDERKKLIQEVIFITGKMFSSVTTRNLIEVLELAQSFAGENGMKSELDKHTFEIQLDRLLDQFPNHNRTSDSVRYFKKNFKELPSKTRGTIVSMVMSVIYPLTFDPLEKLFSKETNIKVEDVFNGKIIVIDVPIHGYGDVGKLTQLIWKKLFMKAVMERLETDGRPTFLWTDESQYFAEKKDSLFTTTTRSLKCSVVYLTQNLPNYYSHVGSEAAVDSIVGSFVMKIFHQNSEVKTNEWASRTIGKVMKQKKTHTSTNGKHSSSSVSTSESLEDDLLPSAFSTLKEGGFMHSNKSEAIVVLPRRLSSGKTWVKAEFRQD